MSYFPERYTHSKNEIEATSDLSKYVTKSELRNVTGVVDTSDFAKKN